MGRAAAVSVDEYPIGFCLYHRNKVSRRIAQLEMVFPLATNAPGLCNPSNGNDGLIEIGWVTVMDVVGSRGPPDIAVFTEAACESGKFSMFDGHVLHPINVDDVIHMSVLIEHGGCYFELRCKKRVHR